MQLCILSERISYLTRHTEEHRKDHASRRGLIILLSRRRKMLQYLREKDFDTYVKVRPAHAIAVNLASLVPRGRGVPCGMPS